MPDREKVIEAFDDAKELVWLDDDEYTIGYNNGIEAGKNIALALLKEKEAVEPYITGSGESFETAETWWYECGNCNKPIDPNDKFCRHCGQEVKWE